MDANLNKIAVILPSSVNHDSRALRTISEMSQNSSISVFFIPKNANDEKINDDFNENVKFYAIRPPHQNIYNKTIQNTLFYYRYSYFVKEILQKKIKFDVVYMHDLISGHIGLSLKKKMNCKLIYDVHDLYIETLNQGFPQNSKGKFSTKHKLMLNLMRLFGSIYEKKIIKKVDLVFTVNETCANYLKEEYNREDILYFRNFPKLRPAPKKKLFLSKTLSISKDKNLIIYIGSIAKGRHLKNIVKSAKYLNTKNNIVIIGDGVLKEELIKLSQIEKTYNSKLFFMDAMKYNELFGNISEAKIGLMILDPINKSKEFALANKICEYMLSGIVPVLSNNIEHQKLDLKNVFSYRINETNPKDIANFCNEIFNNVNELHEKSIKAREAFENRYNWEKEKDFFLNPFNKLIDDCNY